MTELTALETIKSMIRNVAPNLASVLGTPLASVGINLLSSVFNCESKDTDKLLKLIENDSNAINKIIDLEYKHLDTLQQIAYTDYKTEVEDRISARNRQVSLQDYVPTILAVGFLINYALIQFYCVTHAGAEHDVISARFQDVLIMIISYYFGSTHNKKAP